jgi:putative tricarboxylic transport membrane protein
MHGLQPGPFLFQAHNDIIGIIFAVFLLANVLMYFMEMGLMGLFIKVLKVPLNILLPVILVMCAVGAMAANNRVFDAWILLIIGIVGFFAITNGFPLPPIILGYILGPIIEINFRTAILSNQGHLTSLFIRPIAMGLILFGVAMVVAPMINEKIRAKKKQNTIDIVVEGN